MEEKKEETKSTFVKISKIMLYILVMFMLGLVLFLLSLKSVLRYNEWPIYTETNIVNQNQARFPAMTFCPLYHGYKKDVLKTHGIASVNNYNYKDDLTWTSNDTNISSQELFMLATNSFEDIVQSLFIRTISEDDEGDFSVKVLSEAARMGNSLTEQRHRKYGRCYTYYPPPTQQQLGIYYIKAQFHMDTRVYFHSKDQFLDLSGRLGNKVFKGKRYELQINVQDTLQLEYKNVHNGIILYDSDRKCSHESYDKCMYQTLTRNMVEETEDSCTVPWVPTDPRYVSKICTKPKDINKTFWIGWSRITNQKGDCLKPCHTTLINVGAKNEQKNKKNDYAQLYVYFASSVVQSKEHYFITIVKLAGQIGGYIGLFRLSITTLNLVKFNYLIEDTLLRKKKEDNVKDDEEDEDKDPNSNVEDKLIGLTPLGIDGNSFRVSGN